MISGPGPSRSNRHLLRRTAAAFLFSALLAPTGGTAAEVRIDALMAALAGVRTSTASFVEEKQLEALDAPLLSRGTLRWTAPSRLQRRTTEPVPEILTVEGDRLTFEKPGEGLRRSLSLDQAPELRGLIEAVRATLAGDLGALRRYYSVGLEGTTGAWRLTLVPTGRAIRDLLRVIRIDGAEAAITRIETVEASGDVTRMSIEPKAE